eukprot:11224961-Lingulodinium_polyedra.AAC.1
MVRVGVDDMLRQLGVPMVLRASYFAEINSDLGNAAKRLWQQWERAGCGIAHSPVADDVWDILRNGAAPLRRVLQSVPPRGLVLIAGGSPCQELTVVGSSHGTLGLGGPNS